MKDMEDRLRVYEHQQKLPIQHMEKEVLELRHEIKDTRQGAKTFLYKFFPRSKRILSYILNQGSDLIVHFYSPRESKSFFLINVG